MQIACLGRMVLPAFVFLCFSCNPGKDPGAIQGFSISLNEQDLGGQIRWFRDSKEFVSVASLEELDLVCRFGITESHELHEIVVYNTGKESREVRELSIQSGSASSTPADFPENILWHWNNSSTGKLLLELSGSSIVLLPDESLQIFIKE